MSSLDYASFSESKKFSGKVGTGWLEHCNSNKQSLPDKVLDQNLKTCQYDGLDVSYQLPFKELNSLQMPGDKCFGFFPCLLNLLLQMLGVLAFRAFAITMMTSYHSSDDHSHSQLSPLYPLPSASTHLINHISKPKK